MLVIAKNIINYAKAIKSLSKKQMFRELVD